MLRNLVILSSIRNASSYAQSRMFTEKAKGKRTCLYDFHLENKAKIVDFAGFQMPILYEDQSISQSTLHTRNHVTIFDVSHMLQSTLHGRDCVQFIESLTVADVQGLKENNATLSVFTNEQGGIKDDLIITKTESANLFLVSNAGCSDKDITHIKENLKLFKDKKADVEFEIIKDKALIAIQGPGTAKVLSSLVECDLNQLTFMSSTITTIAGVKGCRITRCGYTGEDGVEISIRIEKARYFVETLLASKVDSVKLGGLAARDSLRLEAGLCLYGNDINENTTPIEAGLTWTIGKRRREAGDFPGAQIILKQLKDKPLKKRVGMISNGLSPRAGTNIENEEGEVIGAVTSGAPSPCLSRNISMGYILSKYSKSGTRLKFNIRKKMIDAEIVKMPFVQTKYYNKP